MGDALPTPTGAASGKRSAARGALATMEKGRSMEVRATAAYSNRSNA